MLKRMTTMIEVVAVVVMAQVMMVMTMGNVKEKQRMINDLLMMDKMQQGF